MILDNPDNAVRFEVGERLTWCSACGRIVDITAPDKCPTCGTSFAPRVVGTVTKVDHAERTVTVGSSEADLVPAGPRNRAERRAARRRR